MSLFSLHGAFSMKRRDCLFPLHRGGTLLLDEEERVSVLHIDRGTTSHPHTGTERVSLVYKEEGDLLLI